MDDGEQVFAHQAFQHPRLIRADGRRVGVVDVQRLNWRAVQFTGQRLGELRHVDGAGAGRDQVRPRQELLIEGIQFAGAEQRPAAGVAPVAGDRRQATDGADGHRPAAVPLHPVVNPQEPRPAKRGPGRSVLAGEPLDVRDRQPGDPRHHRRRVFGLHPRLQFVHADAVIFQVIRVFQLVTEEAVHDTERERGVGTGADRQPPVGRLRRFAAVRVDGDDLRPALPRLVHEYPQVTVRHLRIRPPIDDVAALNHRLRVDGRAGAERDVATDRAGGGADGAVE